MASKQELQLLQIPPLSQEEEAYSTFVDLWPGCELDRSQEILRDPSAAPEMEHERCEEETGQDTEEQQPETSPPLPRFQLCIQMSLEHLIQAVTR